MIGSELRGSMPDCFLGDRDLALELHFLDRAQTESDAETEPDSTGDDLRGKLAGLVAARSCDHGQRHISQTAAARLT